MCGCEENGQQFCNFEECISGTCESCSGLETVEDCDNQDLSKAGAKDCKLRCFNSFDNSFNPHEFQCG